MAECMGCRDIAEAETGRNPWAIARLAGGYVWLNPCQYYPGADFLVARRCVAELHELAVEERRVQLMEMAEVAASVQNEFGARKTNYEALGNTVAHLHWWLTPRPHDDRRPAARSGRTSTSCARCGPMVNVRCRRSQLSFADGC
jgi:diadenosine tetraphosphate (Ap4A) HIT family hydrolase